MYYFIVLNYYQVQNGPDFIVMGMNHDSSRDDWFKFLSEYITSLSAAKNELVSQKKVASVIK